MRLAIEACENPRVLGDLYAELAYETTGRPGMWTRFPDREWKVTRAQTTDVATLAELLHETEEHHGHYERTHAEHHWWDWYAPYLSARQNGSSPEQAAAAAGRSMEEVHHVLSR